MKSGRNQEIQVSEGAFCQTSQKLWNHSGKFLKFKDPHDTSYFMQVMVKSSKDYNNQDALKKVLNCTETYFFPQIFYNKNFQTYRKIKGTV